MAKGKDGDAVRFADAFEQERKALGTAWGLEKGHPREDELVGLAFSGGGIRSATFNLGVLRGLAKLGLLTRFHYLSTVSGGGYIGSWLTKCCVPGGIGAVEKTLRGEGAEGGLEREAVEPRPVTVLRENSNYLTPRKGLFSLDTWAIVATYLRNLLLNQATLVALLAAALLVPYLVLHLQKYLVQAAGTMAAGGLVLAVLAIAFASREMARLRYRPAEAPAPRSTVLIRVVAPLLAAAWLASPWLLSAAPDLILGWRKALGGVAACGVLYALAAAIGTAEVRRRARQKLDRKDIGRQVCVALSAIVAGAVGMLLVLALLRAALGLEAESAPGAFLGPLALVVVLLLTGFLHTGLARDALLEEQREWRSRLAGVLMLYTAGMTLIPLGAFYGPAAIQWLAGWLGHWVNTAMVLGWAGSTIGGVLLGRSPVTGPRSPRVGPAAIAGAAAVVFIVGLVVLIASGLPALIEGVSQAPQVAADVDVESGGASSTPEPLSVVVSRHIRRVEADSGVAWMAFLLVGIVALGLSWRVGINDFSMHAMYRDRLVRCYLGASNTKRHEDTFTGNDTRDDIPLAAAWHAGPPPDRRSPFPIINTCLNLMRGRRLAWQRRKGASFALTPLYCGWESDEGPGYRPTAAFAEGLSLGTAVATSGAAASPNMGYHSTPLLAFLMTVFNVRLGRWVGNPARDAWRESGPALGLIYLVCELFGLADDRQPFVYLSDGGHFENLGLYELVRRRCRFIVACDAGEDSKMCFADIGNAVEKCRTDFGAEIELKVDEIRRQPSTGLSGWHGAVGLIRYRGGDTGTLLYVKASLTGDEPIDVTRYAANEPAFPHQTTADQFFDESQFESYRALGEHAILSLIGPLGDKRALLPLTNEELFVKLRQHWYSPSSKVAQHFAKHAAAIDGIFALIRSSEDVKFIDAQIYPEWRELQPGQERILWLPDRPDSVRAGFYVCNQMIQLMETVYLDLDLEHDWEHPDNRGWMNTFRRWAGSGMLRVTWAVCCGTYGARFQTFCERLLGLRPGTVMLGEGVRVPLPPSSAWPKAPEWLNPFEQRLLLEVLGSPSAQVLAGAVLVPIRLTVDDPLAPPEAKPKQSFTMGFVLLQERSAEEAVIRYLRVQNHVRNMGLGRRSLEAIFDRYRGGVELDPLPKDALPASEKPSRTEWMRFTALAESVKQARREQLARRAAAAAAQSTPDMRGPGPAAGASEGTRV